MGKPRNFTAKPIFGGIWIVIAEGSQHARSFHTTKLEAWYEAKRLARGANCEAILKDKNGDIVANNYYGHNFMLMGDR